MTLASGQSTCLRSHQLLRRPTPKFASFLVITILHFTIFTPWPPSHSSLARHFIFLLPPSGRAHWRLPSVSRLRRPPLVAPINPPTHPLLQPHPSFPSPVHPGFSRQSNTLNSVRKNPFPKSSSGTDRIPGWWSSTRMSAVF
jgi:hypothetical protein